MYDKYRIVESIASSVSQYKLYCDRVYRYTPIWGKTRVNDHHYTAGSQYLTHPFNSLRPRQNGRRFPDDTFKRTFLNETIRISTKSSLKFVYKGLINNIPALVLIMAWRRPGEKPLSEPMMVSLPTHICVARHQRFNIIISIRSLQIEHYDIAYNDICVCVCGWVGGQKEVYSTIPGTRCCLIMAAMK